MRLAGVILVALALLLAGCGQDQGTGTPSGGPDRSSSAATEETTRRSPATESVTIDASGEGDVEVRVEISDDMNEMQRGLMGRTALAEDAGMLFVYPEERELSFWMRNTLIPLSIAYMDSEGRIVDIQDMRALDDEEPHYTSAEPAMYALEVNRGFFDERGVEVGDRARLPE